MAKEWAIGFYKNKMWLDCRAAYIAARKAIDGGLCETCQDDLGYIVHHKEALTPENINRPEITTDHKNLEYVCKKCHDEKEAHFVRRERNPYRFDDDGQLLPPIKNNENLIQRTEGGPP